MMKVLKPGMFTTVQDEGRWGYQHYGMPVCGAMDSYSHRLANRLAGNARGAATLEVTLIGPRLEFLRPALAAVGGAEFLLHLNGEPISTGLAFHARAGDELAFGERKRGARAYLAVAGGFDVPRVLGSRSTHVLTKTGGVEGRPLKAGDELAFGEAGADPAASSTGSLPFELPDGGARLRVHATDRSLAGDLTGRRYQVSPQSDRMGYRLVREGEAATRTTGEQISSAVPVGAIQIPPHGSPILLMMDHATVGGYPIAGTVISADVPLAGQLAPGDWIEFEMVELEAADEALSRREAEFA